MMVFRLNNAIQTFSVWAAPARAYKKCLPVIDALTLLRGPPLIFLRNLKNMRKTGGKVAMGR